MGKKEKIILLLILLALFLALFNFWVVGRLKMLTYQREKEEMVSEDNKIKVEESLLPTPTEENIKELKQVLLRVTGDVMLARSVNKKMHQVDNFTYPFEKTAAFLKKADLTLVNLESPFGESCPLTDEGMIFCADPKAIEGLVESGVDLASLANNHIGDQKEKGIERTRQLLETNLIWPIGLREMVTREVNGIRLGFLAYNAVLPNRLETNWADLEVVKSEVTRFSKEVDHLVVYFHWGNEYQKKPIAGGGSPYDPQKLARAAIESGADLILGAHPHVVQETETYQGKIIIYSLGNFVFDQNWSEETKKGEIGEFVFDKEKLVSWKLIPVAIENFQPSFESGENN